MRPITKGNQPTALTDWKLRLTGTGVTADYDAMPSDVRNAVLTSLTLEQGSLCAYTGRRITSTLAHIEHLKPQRHCTKGGEDVQYSNLVACFPAPNTCKCPYGAHAKDDWPAPAETAKFVSPLSIGCERRFEYKYSGKVSAVSGDVAAQTTIEKLGLDHRDLVDQRKAAIRNTLAPGKAKHNHPITLAQAKIRLRSLLAQENPLDEFHFVLVQQLQRHIGAP